MKIKGRYVAQIVIDLETEESDDVYYNKAIKDYWASIHDIVSNKMPRRKFLNTEVTQQSFDMYEVKR